VYKNFARNVIVFTNY